ncbi:phytanoyl-CoA dioxygenase family protein [Nocardioides speluncae]|uniref:phytanoyl-CoA dioxygenase family protein n=1 Tax=Nocardioides speluncae TaxID=2670337 RepID=UPI000D6857CB|nr:phytanoyl-CoA dioxygenase family protein [Nocardioides speluncae]
MAERFLADGFVRIDGAFDRATADECVDRMWPDTGCDRDDPATWTKPVVRLPGYGGGPFARAAGSPALHDAFDRLVGAGRWRPRGGLGTIPVRFPHPDDPGDDGWHVEGSYLPDGATAYHTNVFSKDRALLMLFLFTDVGADDAPTRIRVGSHLDVPPILEEYGERGADFLEIGPRAERASASRPQALVTGDAGTVYLCHPFLVHAAQPHRGHRVRFMAQPPLEPAEPITLDRTDGAYSPVEQAIRTALSR